MTQVLDVAQQESLDARKWERDRRAWNLPRPTVKSTETPRSRSAEERAGRSRSLDWHEFLAAYFPGRGRHDMEALVGYAAYKRKAR